jgi:AbrB family looped-hinge helix DNA binding protein
MEPVWVKVDPAGRMVVPKEMRAALGIPDGGELRLRVEDGELRGLGRLMALARIQREVAGLVPAGVSVVDEFLAERRAEAAREEAEHAAAERDIGLEGRKPAA